MAIVALTPQQLNGPTVTVPTYTGSLSVSNSYTVNNDGKTILHFKKSGAGIATITVSTPGTVDGVAIADPTFAVPATTGDVMVGPFRPSTYNDGDSNLTFTPSDVAGLTVAVIRIP